jgi:hypothetical protein
MYVCMHVYMHLCIYVYMYYIMLFKGCPGWGENPGSFDFIYFLIPSHVCMYVHMYICTVIFVTF